jgi:hypothetical protein
MVRGGGDYPTHREFRPRRNTTLIQVKISVLAADLHSDSE